MKTVHRTSVYRLLFSLLTCLLIAGGAYFWATSMIDSLYAFRSPLTGTPPAPGEKLGPPATRRVVFVLVDALRQDTALDAKLMPTLARLRQGGAAATMHSRPLSFSEPGYSTLLTGAWPEFNSGPAMNLDYDEIPPLTQDTLYAAANRAGMKTAVSGYYWFEKLLAQANVTAHFYTPGEDAAADRAVVDAALPWLDQPETYQLILIHLDQVDYAGHHQGGPRGAEWAAAAQRSDALLAEILWKLDLSQDTILVASDHGQIDAGGHGGDDAVTLVEPFVLAGAGVKPGPYADMQMVDVAPTLAALLGVNIPASAQGQVLADMLTLPAETAAALPERQSAQQEQLLRVYTAAIQQVDPPAGDNTVAAWQKELEAARSARLAGERLPRALVGGAVLLALLCLLFFLRGPRMKWMLAAALAYLLVFHLRYAVLDGTSYSFSSVLGSTELIIYVGSTALLALVIAWALFAWFSRLYTAAPLDAANDSLGFTLVVTGALGLFALVNYALNGLGVTWTLPEPAVFFLGLLALLQMLFVTLVGPLLSGLSALLSKMRKGF